MQRKRIMWWLFFSTPSIFVNTESHMWIAFLKRGKEEQEGRKERRKKFRPVRSLQVAAKQHESRYLRTGLPNWLICGPIFKPKVVDQLSASWVFFCHLPLFAI